MENNESFTGQENQTENTENYSDGQETSQNGNEKKDRLFTQEEVNGFIQSRINRLRGQIEKESKAEYEQKISDLESREMKLLTREMLSDRGMPKELANIITCTNEDELKTKLDILESCVKGKTEEGPTTGFFRIDPETGEKIRLTKNQAFHVFPKAPERKNNISYDPIRQAMNLGRKE